MSIRCRECREEHLTVRCPLRSPEDRPKDWQQLVEQYNEAEEAKPFHCLVPMHQGKNATISSISVDQFWQDIRLAHMHSLYRDFAGILNKANGTLLPPEHSAVEPGSYIFVGRTYGMSDKKLYQVLDDARDALKQERPLCQEKIEKVHNALLLAFNHFSLQHEGSSLGLDETEMITKLLASKNSKREIKDDELEKINKEVPGSKHDITEAVNHILVSQHLQELAKNDITETTVLQLHNSVMDGILTNVEEGRAGEYRKVSINVLGETSLRPSFVDIPPLMSKWSSQELIQKEDEHIIQFEPDPFSFSRHSPVPRWKRTCWTPCCEYATSETRVPSPYVSVNPEQHVQPRGSQRNSEELHHLLTTTGGSSLFQLSGL